MRTLPLLPNVSSSQIGGRWSHVKVIYALPYTYHPTELWIMEQLSREQFLLPFFIERFEGYSVDSGAAGTAKE